MKININYTEVGRNVNAIMQFDGLIVATINCTPDEFNMFHSILHLGLDQYIDMAHQDEPIHEHELMVKRVN